MKCSCLQKDELLVWYLIISCMVLISVHILGGIFHLIHWIPEPITLPDPRI